MPWTTAADPSRPPPHGTVAVGLYTAPMGTSDRDEHSEPVAIASFATYGEAEVAQAKLSGYGIEAAIDDQIEGGTVVVQGEPSVVVEVRAADAEDARRILSEGAADLGNSQGES
jgi:hypothetical protein